MKGVIGIALAFALVLSIVPGIAGDTSRAFSTMPAATRAGLAPLPDDQLATLASAKRSAGTPRDEQLAAVQGKEMLPNGLMLMQILNSLFVILDPATTVSSGMGQVNTMSTQSFSHTQQNIGGGSQTNMIEVRQQ
jgi:hypothetical protein